MSAGHVLFDLSVRLSIRNALGTKFCISHFIVTVKPTSVCFLAIVLNILELCNNSSFCPTFRLFDRHWRLNLGTFTAFGCCMY